MNVEYSVEQIEHAWSVVLGFAVGCACVGLGLLILFRIAMEKSEGKANGD